MIKLLKQLAGLAMLSYLVAGAAYLFVLQPKLDTQEFLCRQSKRLPIGTSGIAVMLLWPQLVRNDHIQAAALAACRDERCQNQVLRPSCGPGKPA